MNLFDSMGEDLTDMMAEVATRPDHSGALMRRLEACHVEVCKLSRDIRREAAADEERTAYPVRRRA